MKFLSRFAFMGLVLAAFTGGWIYLYMHSSAVDGERQNETLALLKDLKQIDSDWNADVLKSQSEINLSYDPLVQPLHKFAQIFSRLKAETARLNDETLTKAAGGIQRSIDEKATLIDRFKAQNSLLKNSLRYAPTANKEIQAQINAMQLAAAKPADVATLAQLENSIGSLVSDALHYNSVPDAETAEQLKAGIERMRASSLSYPAFIREPVDNLLSHLGVILRMRAAESASLNDISQIAVVARIDGLNNLLSARFQNELMQQYTYQRLLLGYSALALSFVFGAAGLIAYRNATERERLTSIVDKQTLELKENEAQLVHAQRMNALGEMVAGITHEINTPLAAVKSGLQSSNDLIEMVREYVDESAKLAILLAANPADEAGQSSRRTALIDLLTRVNRLRDEITSFDAIGTVSKLLGEGIRNVEYIHQVIVNMLNFSRLDRSRICPVKVEEGIDSVLLIMNHLLKKVRLAKRYGNTRPISCDIAQINQVVLNLIKNASQALPENGGDIAIETSSTATELRIAVLDSGCGIPGEILEKIWEPFFTTKKAGSGSGLGLSTCKKIIEAHGGRINVTTAVGKGSAFTIVLPVTPPKSLYRELGQAPNGRLLSVA
jgi:two-component system NtrC family sensor kinase